MAIILTEAVIEWQDQAWEARKQEPESPLLGRTKAILARYAEAEALALVPPEESLERWRKLWDEERAELQTELSRITGLRR